VTTGEGAESLLATIAFYLDDSRGWPKKLRAFYEVTNAALRWPCSLRKFLPPSA